MLERQPASDTFHSAPRERETESRPDRLAAIDAVEAVEDVVAGVKRDARTTVDDIHDGERRRLGETQADASGLRQVNAAVPGEFERGEHGLTVECGGPASPPWTMRVL